MPTRTRWIRWISVAAGLVLIVGAQGAAAQPSPVPQARPPFPNTPQSLVFVPPNCRAVLGGTYNGTQAEIKDLSVLTSTVVVTQSLPYIWSVAAYTAISHTFSSDLEITLVSPAGTRVTLANRRGATYGDVFADTAWTDDAPTAATQADYSVPQRYLIPEEAMGAFQGQNGAGTWSLVVADENGGDTGWLNTWYVSITSLNEAPIATTTHFSEVNNSSIGDPGILDAFMTVSGVGNRLISAKLTTDISHPAPSDLNIELSSPNLLSTTISHRNGGSLADWFAGTQWYDKAGDTYPPGAVTMAGAVYPTSPLTAAVPEGAMGHFLASNPNGTWDLHISDDTSGNAGTLNSWALDVTTGHCLAHDYLPIVSQ